MGNVMNSDTHRLESLGLPYQIKVHIRCFANRISAQPAGSPDELTIHHDRLVLNGVVLALNDVELVPSNDGLVKIRVDRELIVFGVRCFPFGGADVSRNQIIQECIVQLKASNAMGVSTVLKTLKRAELFAFYRSIGILLALMSPLLISVIAPEYDNYAMIIGPAVMVGVGVHLGFKNIATIRRNRSVD